jgi:hypothetical protein
MFYHALIHPHQMSPKKIQVSIGQVAVEQQASLWRLQAFWVDKIQNSIGELT